MQGGGRRKEGVGLACAPECVEWAVGGGDGTQRARPPPPPFTTTTTITHTMAQTQTFPPPLGTHRLKSLLGSVDDILSKPETTIAEKLKV